MSILKARNRQPIISFGLGLTEKNVKFGDVVKVYQDRYYLDVNLIKLKTGLQAKKINNYEFNIVADLDGEQEIRAISRNSVNSNKLKLNISFPEFDINVDENYHLIITDEQPNIFFNLDNNGHLIISL